MSNSKIFKPTSFTGFREPRDADSIATNSANPAKWSETNETNDTTYMSKLCQELLNRIDNLEYVTKCLNLRIEQLELLQST